LSLFKDSYVKLALCLLLLQQLVLGLSTYSIAVAGKNVAVQDGATAIYYVTWFFVFALTAFIVNVVSTIAAEKGTNQLLKSYYGQLKTLPTQMKVFDTSGNKSTTVSWLVGEAPSTISDLISFAMESVGTILNVTITLFVFWTVLGTGLSITIIVALSLSVVVIFLVRSRIGGVGVRLQNERLHANNHVSRYWDGTFRSTGHRRDRIHREQDERLSKYLDLQLKYTAWEQAGAAIPILLAVSLITAYLALNSDVSLATVGVMVAVLPRTLQLLGSAHSISVISSRFFLYKAKHHKLQAFWHQIEALDTQTVIKWDDIEIRRVCDRQIVRPDDLLDVTLQNGRYVVTGPNGSGKSSYLKQLMTQSTDAIFIGPDNSLLLPEDDGRSTGEKVSDMLSMILQDAPRLVLLDEWDANLDVKRRSTFNDHIELMSKTRIVVEVRHDRQPERNQNML